MTHKHPCNPDSPCEDCVKKEINQCDGCQKGLPLMNGKHKDPDVTLGGWKVHTKDPQQTDEQEKYPTKNMVQACIRKMYTLRALYTEETLLEITTYEMYTYIHTLRAQAISEYKEELRGKIEKEMPNLKSYSTSEIVTERDNRSFIIGKQITLNNILSLLE